MSVSVSVAIVQMLEKYHKAPIDFVAEVVGRKRSEVEPYLISLQDAGVLRREDDLVILNAGNDSSRPRWW